MNWARKTSIPDIHDICKLKEVSSRSLIESLFESKYDLRDYAGKVVRIFANDLM